jgi:N-acetylmuramoyl-L-alanine amidase
MDYRDYAVAAGGMSFSPDYAGARVFPSPNQGDRLRPISALILHYTGTPTSSGALALLCSPEAEVSAHYFVEETGEILQLVPESRRAWHAGKSFWAGETDLNSASIGIEIVHPGHCDPRPFQLAQIEAVAALARDICARRRIRPERVLAHSDVAVSRKIDPGEFFPWDLLAARGVGVFVAEDRAEGLGLAFGDRSDEVCDLQRSLADIGYAISQTGIYDEQTEKVVMAFQRHFRRSCVDGRADASTLATLRSLKDVLEASASR